MHHRSILLACTAIGLVAAAYLYDRNKDDDDARIESPGSGHTGSGPGFAPFPPPPVAPDAPRQPDRSVAPAAATTANAAAATGMQTVVIPVLEGTRPLAPALRVQIPAGWRAVAGGYRWNPQNPCASVEPQLNWQAASADGSQGFEILAARAWQSEALVPGCPVAHLDGARAYLEWLARERRPDARILDYRERPDLAATVQVPEALSMPGMDMQMRNRAEGGEILVGWNEHGREMRASMAVSLLLQELHRPDAFGRQQRTLMVESNPVAILHAPDGQLDLRLAQRITASVEVDAAWADMLRQHQQAMNRIAGQGAADRSAIIAESHAEISRIRNEGWARNQQRDHDSFQRLIHGINETRPYRDDQAGRDVTLSNHYRYAWRLNDGRYYQTDDPDFHPYRELGVDGRLLSPQD